MSVDVHPAPVEAHPVRSPRDQFTIEQATTVESPREFRLSPDGRRVAYTAEAAGARQIFLLPVRGGYPEQLTASEKAVSDPQWSPDGRRLAFVRDDAISIVEVEGSRRTLVTEHPAGNRSPRWCADGHRIAFISRRRGWSQVWIVDAPVPRRGRPAARPRYCEPRALTPAGVDVEEFSWSPSGREIVVTSQRLPDLLTSQVHVLDVATCEERLIGGERAWEAGPRWLRDGSGLLLVSDGDGWFQVVRVSLDGRRQVLTAGPHEHGDVRGSAAPLPSPDGKRFVYTEFAGALADVRVAPLAVEAGSAPDAGADRSVSIVPFEGVWTAIDWLPDSSAVLATGSAERSPEDLWLLPVPGEAGEAVRPRRLTHSLPLVVDTSRFSIGTSVVFEARDGQAIHGTLWLPAALNGDGRVPCLIHSHGGPTWQALRSWQPFRQLVLEAGIAFFSVDFRGSTGYGREFRWANVGEWGHADAFDVVDAAHWAAAQDWCDGRLAHYGGSYGGYLTLCVLVEEPGLWRCGIDLFGDSEIAESYRHGDRQGRIDLERMMGKPDDPAAAPAFRRGSPLYRAERIEAPLLILHGRKDKTVVPLMSEKIVEALEIEGKLYEIHWFDDEGHGLERRENRRDGWKRCIDFLHRHLLEVRVDD